MDTVPAAYAQISSDRAADSAQDAGQEPGAVLSYTIDESAAVPSGAVLQSEDLTADTLYAGESPPEGQ